MVFPCLLCRSGAQPGSADLHPSMLRVWTRWACHGYGDTGPALLTSEQTNWICRTSFMRVANFPGLQTHSWSKFAFEMGKIWVELWLFAASRSCRNCASDRAASTGDFAQSTWNEKQTRNLDEKGLLHLATKLKMDHWKGRSNPLAIWIWHKRTALMYLFT